MSPAWWVSLTAMPYPAVAVNDVIGVSKLGGSSKRRAAHVPARRLSGSLATDGSLRATDPLILDLDLEGSVLQLLDC